QWVSNLPTKSAARMAPANSGLEILRQCCCRCSRLVEFTLNHLDRRTCMFANLIESSSHAREFKRRGSFVLFTTATYVVLFAITGVVSIFAYDARLEEQNLEMVTLISPQEIAPEQPEVTRPVRQPNDDRTAHNNGDYDIRRTPTASVDQPTLPPDKVSTA